MHSPSLSRPDFWSARVGSVSRLLFQTVSTAFPALAAGTQALLEKAKGSVWLARTMLRGFCRAPDFESKSVLGILVVKMPNVECRAFLLREGVQWIAKQRVCSIKFAVPQTQKVSLQGDSDCAAKNR